MHEAFIENQYSSSTYTVIHRKKNNFHNKYEKIIESIENQITKHEFFYSLEVSPKFNFTLNYNEFTRNPPLFTAVTWHVNVENNIRIVLTEAPAFQMAKEISKSELVLLHLSCHQLDQRHVNEIYSNGIKNIFALRGDIVHTNQHFKYAIDLISALRLIYNQNISLTVAGYPETHPNSISKYLDLKFLKQKVDAGGDFIITQICFSFSKIIDFIKSCRKIGINVPIIPGIFIPFSFMQLIAVCNTCNIQIPKEQFVQFEMQKDNSEKFQEVAKMFAIELINNLIDASKNESGENYEIPGVHFFSMNYLKNVLQVVEECNL